MVFEVQSSLPENTAGFISAAISISWWRWSEDAVGDPIESRVRAFVKDYWALFAYCLPPPMPRQNANKYTRRNVWSPIRSVLHGFASRPLNFFVPLMTFELISYIQNWICQQPPTQSNPAGGLSGKQRARRGHHNRFYSARRHFYDWENQLPVMVNLQPKLLKEPKIFI